MCFGRSILLPSLFFLFLLISTRFLSQAKKVCFHLFLLLLLFPILPQTLQEVRPQPCVHAEGWLPNLGRSPFFPVPLSLFFTPDPEKQKVDVEQSSSMGGGRSDDASRSVAGDQGRQKMGGGGDERILPGNEKHSREGFLSLLDVGETGKACQPFPIPIPWP